MRLLAAIVLVIALPFMVVISIAIFLESKSNVFFIQERIGKDKKEFLIYKFRTMENEKVTKVGRFLRKLGLDELPQLLNIIKGEMTFVGPRPLTNSDIVRLGWHTSDFQNRWSIRPGITGMAQLSNTCSAENSIQNDLYYIDNRSVLLNIKIVLKSLLVPIKGKFTG